MALSVERMFASEEKSVFCTVHTKEHDFGEIEPTFFHQFKYEASAVWKLYDKDGLRHRVRLEFTHPDGVPRITEGWNVLREHYKWEDDHKILFKYYGKSNFQIIPMGPVTPANYPTWHSLSMNIRGADNFYLTITENPDVVPQLELPEDLAWYLQRKGLPALWFVGENREKHKCTLVFGKDDWPNPGWISKGWPEVCGINGFKVGDRINFRIKNIYENHSIYVFKV